MRLTCGVLWNYLRFSFLASIFVGLSCTHGLALWGSLISLHGSYATDDDDDDDDGDADDDADADDDGDDDGDSDDGDDDDDNYDGDSDGDGDDNSDNDDDDDDNGDDDLWWRWQYWWRVDDDDVSRCRLNVGSYVWTISEVQRRRTESSRSATVHSPCFYTSQHGYKLCLRVNLNGVDSGADRYIAIFVHVNRGAFDAILDWPFSGTGRALAGLMEHWGSCCAPSLTSPGLLVKATINFRVESRTPARKSVSAIYHQGRFQGGPSEISGPPVPPLKKVQDKAATCQNFSMLHY